MLRLPKELGLEGIGHYRQTLLVLLCQQVFQVMRLRLS